MPATIGFLKEPVSIKTLSNLATASFFPIQPPVLSSLSSSAASVLSAFRVHPQFHFNQHQAFLFSCCIPSKSAHSNSAVHLKTAFPASLTLALFVASSALTKPFPMTPTSSLLGSLASEDIL